MKYSTDWSPLSYYCNKTAPRATYEALGFRTNDFVKFGSFKTCGEHNANVSCSKHYLYYYYHYYSLLALSKLFKGAAIVAKNG